MPKEGRKMKNLMKKNVPLWAFILALIAVGSIVGVVVWYGQEITTITVPALVKPTVTPAAVGLEIPVNTYEEVEFTISNPNNIPILVNSLWTVRVDGTVIAEDKYSVDDLQNFVWCKHISTSPAEQYGIDEVTYDLIIPQSGYTIYTLVYYIPPSYTDPTTGETVFFEFESVVEVEWDPMFTEYIGDFYDGTEEWDNPFVPYWYPTPPL